VWWTTPERPHGRWLRAIPLLRWEYGVDQKTSSGSFQIRVTNKLLPKTLWATFDTYDQATPPPRWPISTTGRECEVTDQCLQLFGAYGYMSEYQIARLCADARVQKIYGGTNEIQRELVGRQL
jgi:hypothetical protein